MSKIVSNMRKMVEREKTEYLGDMIFVKPECSSSPMGRIIREACDKEIERRSGVLSNALAMLQTLDEISTRFLRPDIIKVEIPEDRVDDYYNGKVGESEFEVKTFSEKSLKNRKECQDRRTQLNQLICDCCGIDPSCDPDEEISEDEIVDENQEVMEWDPYKQGQAIAKSYGELERFLEKNKGFVDQFKGKKDK